jgi:hypothetical protein
MWGYFGCAINIEDVEYTGQIRAEPGNLGFHPPKMHLAAAAAGGEQRAIR